MNIANARLANQQVAAHRFDTPGQLVSWLCAAQAQDFQSAKWSVGLRLSDAVNTDIENAVEQHEIVRIWLMRGTIHFVAASDLGWIRRLLSPQLISAAANRQRELELDDAVFARCGKHIANALQGGIQLSRQALYDRLEAEGITVSAARGYHILWRLAQEGIICHGTHEGKQPTFALLGEWHLPDRSLSREQSLAELASRYFASHGPATLKDFIGWSGLRVKEAREGIEAAGNALVSETINGQLYWMTETTARNGEDTPSTFLLPGFDEYLLGYTDRSACLDPLHAKKICPGSNGIFLPTVLSNGKVVGTWKRTVRTNSVAIELNAFDERDSARLVEEVQEAAAHYGRFVGKVPVITSKVIKADD